MIQKRLLEREPLGFLRFHFSRVLDLLLILRPATVVAVELGKLGVTPRKLPRPPGLEWAEMFVHWHKGGAPSGPRASECEDEICAGAAREILVIHISFWLLRFR